MMSASSSAEERRGNQASAARVQPSRCGGNQPDAGRKADEQAGTEQHEPGAVEVVGHEKLGPLHEHCGDGMGDGQRRERREVPAGRRRATTRERDECGVGSTEQVTLGDILAAIPAFSCVAS